MSLIAKTATGTNTNLSREVMVKPKRSNRYLSRYTDLPALIYLLSEQKITLLDPRSWDDSNDSHYLSVYRQKGRLKSLLALCFTQAGETYHHWRVFAGSSSGVCIRFKRAELVKGLRKHEGIRIEGVEYLTLGKIRDKSPQPDHLPFVKRWAFKDEHELRVIYESRTDKLTKLDIPVSLSWVSKIILSPWLPEDLTAPVKRLLTSAAGGRKLTITRSSIVSNEEWKGIGETWA